MNDMEPKLYDEYYSYLNDKDFEEFHAVYTMQLGELIRDGAIDFTDGTWYVQGNGSPIKWYNDEQRDRFWQKFEQHFYWREIGELPFKRWKWDLLARIAELMPKYCLLYDILDKGVDPMQLENEYGKSRYIFSNFPQTMLSDNEDYASTGNDSQYERIKDGSFFDTMQEFQEFYKDPDLALLQELDSFFYCVLSSNMNGY